MTNRYEPSRWMIPDADCSHPFHLACSLRVFAVVPLRRSGSGHRLSRTVTTGGADAGSKTRDAGSKVADALPDPSAAGPNPRAALLKRADAGSEAAAALARSVSSGSKPSDAASRVADALRQDTAAAEQDTRSAAWRCGRETEGCPATARRGRRDSAKPKLKNSEKGLGAGSRWGEETDGLR